MRNERKRKEKEVNIFFESQVEAETQLKTMLHFFNFLGYKKKKLSFWKSDTEMLTMCFYSEKQSLIISVNPNQQDAL